MDDDVALRNDERVAAGLSDRRAVSRFWDQNELEKLCGGGRSQQPGTGCQRLHFFQHKTLNTPPHTQLQELSARPHIVVATPGMAYENISIQYVQKQNARRTTHTHTHTKRPHKVAALQVGLLGSSDKALE